MKINSKRAQATGSSAAVLILIIAALVVIYVLVLPPAEREQILGGQSTQPPVSVATTETEQNETLLMESPGRLDYLKETEIEHVLPAVNLYSTTQSTLLKKVDSVYVKSGWLDKQSRNISFSIEDLNFLTNGLLGFNVQQIGKGRLIIKLNGNEILNREITTSLMDPIELPSDFLQTENSLEFSVSGVGAKFWTTNEYTLNNMRITADVTDVSSQEARLTFIVTSTEKENVQRLFVKFFPDCNIKEVGRLDVSLNNHQIFSAVPDCGLLRPLNVDTHFLFSGENELTFRGAKGAYLIDQISIKSELTEPTHPVYYFDLDEDLFKTTTETEEVCGDYDNICPEDCDADEDYDCCFAESRNNYWCDVETRNLNDRCVGVVEKEDCSRCSSGYEEKGGSPAENCEGLCGDDEDSKCPSGCSVYYDRDCCYAQSENNYWCDVVPKVGLDSVCEQELSSGECDDCSDGYVSKKRSTPDCKITSTGTETEELKQDYDVNLELKFTNDIDYKKAKIYVNGRLLNLDTRSADFERNIDQYLESGANSIEIIPTTDLDIAALKVTLETR